MEIYEKICPTCKGEQEMDEQICRECMGVGVVPKNGFDILEEEFDREMNAGDEKYERGNDK